LFETGKVLSVGTHGSIHIPVKETAVGFQSDKKHKSRISLSQHCDLSFALLSPSPSLLQPNRRCQAPEHRPAQWDQGLLIFRLDQAAAPDPTPASAVSAPHTY